MSRSAEWEGGTMYTKEEVARANSLSPRPLWERWGYACEISCNGNEIRVYPKGEDGKKIAGSCLYRSFYRKDHDLWLHRKVDSGEILVIDIPGNKGNNHVFKKDDFGHVLLDDAGEPIPSHVTTNISLATAFERNRLFSIYRETGEPYNYFQTANAIKLVLEHGEPMEKYLESVKDILPSERTGMPKSRKIKQSVFTNKRIFLHNCGDATARAECLAYLSARHINEETARIFEDAHVLYYNSGSDRYFPSLAFCGWKRVSEINGVPLPVPSYEPAFVAKRLITGEKTSMRTGDAQLHGDIFGSRRAYVPFLEGHDPSLAIFVEGGVDMLSIAEIAIRTGHPIPTIVMMAGSSNHQFWENESLGDTLRKADRALFIGENDTHLTPQKQRAIRSSLERNLVICRKIIKDSNIIYPPCKEGIKDANDMLKPENADFLAGFTSEIFGMAPKDAPGIRQ